jgi:catechol 2,3-dioxygenase-like lactoylglutathione lyase family enzyme
MATVMELFVIVRSEAVQREHLYPLTKSSEFRLKLYPKDFYKVKDFYENLLGYPIVDSWDGEESKGVMFDTGGAILELLTPKGEYLPFQGSDISLKVDNVWELWERLKDYPSIVKALDSYSWGDTGFKIADPEGFKISFFTSTKEKPL